MSKLSFKEFIEKEKAADSRIKSFDWEGRKQFYLNQIDVLYKNVEDYLREYIDSHDVTLETTHEEIEEEIVGKYEVPVMNIYIYGKHAALVPAGTNMIGTPGRVDLVGGIEMRRILLADKNRKRPQLFAAVSWTKKQRKQLEKTTMEWLSQKYDFIWKFITDQPDIRFLEVNETSFLRSLQEVLDG